MTRLASDYGIHVVIGGEAWRDADELAAAHIPVVLDPDVNLPYTFDQLGNRQTNAVIVEGKPASIDTRMDALARRYLPAGK